MCRSRLLSLRWSSKRERRAGSAKAGCEGSFGQAGSALPLEVSEVSESTLFERPGTSGVLLSRGTSLGEDLWRRWCEDG